METLANPLAQLIADISAIADELYCVACKLPTESAELQSEAFDAWLAHAESARASVETFFRPWNTGGVIRQDILGIWGPIHDESGSIIPGREKELPPGCIDVSDGPALTAYGLLGPLPQHWRLPFTDALPYAIVQPRLPISDPEIAPEFALNELSSKTTAHNYPTSPRRVAEIPRDPAARRAVGFAVRMRALTLVKWLRERATNLKMAVVPKIVLIGDGESVRDVRITLAGFTHMARVSTFQWHFLDSLRTLGTAEFYYKGQKYDPAKPNDGKWNYLVGLLPELRQVIHREQPVDDNRARFRIDPLAQDQMERHPHQ